MYEFRDFLGNFRQRFKNIYYLHQYAFSRKFVTREFIHYKTTALHSGTQAIGISMLVVRTVMKTSDNK